MEMIGIKMFKDACFLDHQQLDLKTLRYSLRCDRIIMNQYTTVLRL